MIFPEVPKERDLSSIETAAGQTELIRNRIGDNGRSSPENSDNPRPVTMGFAIMKNLVRQLSGKLEQAGEEGKEFRTVIPL